jgi:serine/threonine-protein kinase HipA
VYDVICGAVWGSVTKSFSQKIGGESRGENLNGGHWRRLAHECGLNPKQVFERVRALASLAHKESEAAAAEVAALPAGGA